MSLFSESILRIFHCSFQTEKMTPSKDRNLKRLMRSHEATKIEAPILTKQPMNFFPLRRTGSWNACLGMWNLTTTRLSHSCVTSFQGSCHMKSTDLYTIWWYFSIIHDSFLMFPPYMMINIEGWHMLRPAFQMDIMLLIILLCLLWLLTDGYYGH